MPFADGTYSQADVTKKLMGSAARLAKGKNLQAVVYLLCDAIGMIEKISGMPVIDIRRSASAGMPQGEFSKAVVGEKIGLAIMEIGQQKWARAGASIWAALVLLQRMGIQNGQAVTIPERKAVQTCTTEG